MPNETGSDFLKEKYDLHNSDEVESAVLRIESKTKEKVPKNPDARIQNYLDRLSRVINPPELEGHPDFDRQGRNLSILKNAMYEKFVIKPDEIPESYWENQKRIIRERGQGADLDQVDFETLKEQNTEAIIADQESSLDTWVDYLASKDAKYPDWLKYFAIRSVTSMGGFDKERHAFTKRSKGTTKPFPDLNREALAYVLDAVEKKYESKTDLANLEGEKKEQFEKLLTLENFAKLYAWAIEEVTPASVEQIRNTEGRWVRYEQGSDHMPLVDSLQGHGTGWCTAGESTARAQLDSGDFYVYYSYDQSGNPIIPRAAIRMEGDSIGEVRGIAKEQNLDHYINDVVQNKLHEFPDGRTYEKKVAAMKMLTDIDNKVKSKQELTKDDLAFLYEIDSKIQGFGYHEDPRIKELRGSRDTNADALIVLECEADEIAHSQEEINEKTKAYIGQLFPRIFQRLSHLENIYTSFPEGNIRREKVEIGGKSSDILESELESRGINISDYAKDMLRSKDFKTLENPESMNLVKLKVGDLGFDSYSTTNELYARAEEIGLELCPAEVGPYLRLQDTDQPRDDWYNIAMKQIADRSGNPAVFSLNSLDGGLWLRSSWARPVTLWHSDFEFVFRIPQVSQES